AVGARGAGVVDPPHVAARRGAGGGEPLGAEDGGVLGLVTLLVGGHARDRLDEQLVGAGRVHAGHGDAEPPVTDLPGRRGGHGGRGGGGDAPAGRRGQQRDAHAGAERADAGELDGVGARLVAEDDVHDLARGVVGGEAVEAGRGGRGGDHVPGHV